MVSRGLIEGVGVDWDLIGERGANDAVGNVEGRSDSWRTSDDGESDGARGEGACGVGDVAMVDTGIGRLEIFDGEGLAVLFEGESG